MPRRKKSIRSRRKNFVAIPFQTTLALSTLGPDTALLGNLLGAALNEDLFVISVDTHFTIRGHTATEGPIEVGYAHGDLTVAEVQEALQANVIDPDDIIAKERARRPVRRAGVFPGLNVIETLNDGRPLRSKIRILIGDGHEFNFFAVNRDGSALTTGTQLEVMGTLYGRWLR